MSLLRVIIAVLVILGTFSHAMRADEPSDCSVKVEVVNRIGVYRTWLNALEADILNQKGFTVCQGDVTPRCKTEFKLELFFQPNNLNRNVTIFKSRQVVFNQDYPANPHSIGSLKILKTIPTCAELKEIAASTR